MILNDRLLGLDKPNNPKQGGDYMENEITLRKLQNLITSLNNRFDTIYELRIINGVPKLGTIPY